MIARIDVVTRDVSVGVHCCARFYGAFNADGGSRFSVDSVVTTVDLVFPVARESIRSRIVELQCCRNPPTQTL